MSYGIQIFRNYGTATLFDTTESSRGQFVVDQGTIAMNTALNYTAGDNLLVRPSATISAGSAFGFIGKTTVSGSGQSATFSTTFRAVVGSGSLSYVILRDSNQATAQTGSYGIVCKTSSSIVEFDSRLFAATQEFLVDELYTLTGYGHGSTIHNHANDGRYFSTNILLDQTLTNFVRQHGYIFERTQNSSTIIWNGQSLFNGRLFGSSSTNGTVVGLAELNQGPGGYSYTTWLQPYFAGEFRT